MSLINKEISEFKVNGFDPVKNKFIEVSKKDILGKWNVFFFYPGDFTFVCPTELEDLALLFDEFEKENVNIYTISTDSHFVHKAWYDVSNALKGLKYTMLSDKTHELSNDFEVLTDEDGMSERGTFIINPKGKVASYEISSGGVGRNASELLRRIKAIKYTYENGSEVCPARWKPNDETIKPGIDMVGKI